MTARKPGPGHDKVLEIISRGPISSKLIAELLNTTISMAWSRAKELYAVSAIDCFQIPRTGQKKEKITIWYVPGCGIPPEKYQHPYTESKPGKKPDKQSGVDKEHLEWLKQVKLLKAKKEEKKQRIMRI